MPVETVEDEEDKPVVQNNAPRNKAWVLELADSSDDDEGLPQVVKHRIPTKNIVSFKLYTYQRRLYLLEKKRVLYPKPRIPSGSERNLVGSARNGRNLLGMVGIW